MPQSQNGWPVLDSTRLRVWLIPDTIARGGALSYRNGDDIKLPLARGRAGWLLVFVALWWHERVERLDTQAQHDEWGWAPRNIRGSSVISNHASGTAVDLNATLHPLGVPAAKTMSPVQIKRCLQLQRRLLGTVRWGGTWDRPDAMHWELNASRVRVVAMWAVLRLTPRGLRVAKLNPWRKR